MLHEIDSSAPFPQDELVSASELREFVYCERAWFLSRKGYAVSPPAQARRTAGLAFHEARAGAEQRAQGSQVYIWILLLILAAVAVIIAVALRQGT